jgi:regulator of sigma E protease
LDTWEALEAAYERVPPQSQFTVRFKKVKNRTDALKSGDEQSEKLVQWMKPRQSRGLDKDFGLYSSELFVEKVVPKSPAELAGVQSGDRLVGVGAKEVQSFFDLKNAVQASGEKDGIVHLKWERSGQFFSKSIRPTATSARDPLLNKVMHFTVGVMPMLVMSDPKTVVLRVWNPLKLLVLATDRMITFSWRNLVSLRKIFTGDVSVGTLGGPIMIGKIAGESLARGLIVFLTNMAIFSIGLGVLNILPVPVLDGGHLLLLGVEMIRGRALTVRQMEIVQGIGLVFILTLMGIAFHNDLARLFYS